MDPNKAPMDGTRLYDPQEDGCKAQFPLPTYIQFKWRYYYSKQKLMFL